MHCSLQLSQSVNYSTPEAIDIPSNLNSLIYSKSPRFSVKPRFSIVTNPGFASNTFFLFPLYVVTWSSELNHRSFSQCSTTAISGETFFFHFIFSYIYFVPNLYRQHSMHPSIPSLLLTFVETLMKIIAMVPQQSVAPKTH